MKLHFKGNLTFDPVEPNILSDKVVSCEFELNVDEEGGVTGSFFQADYFEITDKKIPVTGFRDEDFFSLVAVFPLRPIYDKEGQISLDPEQINHDITFYANLSEDGKRLEGNWEIIDRTEIQTELNVYVQCGFFDTTLQ